MRRINSLLSCINRSFLAQRSGTGADRTNSYQLVTHLESRIQAAYLDLDADERNLCKEYEEKRLNERFCKY